MTGNPMPMRQRVCRGGLWGLAALLGGCATPTPDVGPTPSVAAPAQAERQEPLKLFTQGVAYAKQGDTDRAIAIFRQLTHAHPDLPGPFNNLAVLYASRGQYEAARQVLLKAIALQPDLDTAHENLGDVYTKLAIRSYERAFEIENANRRAQSKADVLSRTLGQRGRREQPVAMAAEIAGVGDTLGVIGTTSAGQPSMTCPTIGPVPDGARAKTVGDWLRRHQVPTATRVMEEAVTAYYQIFLPPFATIDEANHHLHELKQAGITESSLIARGELRHGISLGVYRKKASAKRRVQQLHDLGIRPQLRPQLQARQAYWLDVGPVAGDDPWNREFQQAFPSLRLRSSACGPPRTAGNSESPP